MAIDTRFLGYNYPIQKTVQGYFPRTGGVDQIKADMLQLLLTEPGERVMEPSFGTPLNRLIFEPGDPVLLQQTRTMIAQVLARWEPRVQVMDVNVTVTPSDVRNVLASNDTGIELGRILLIQIKFKDPQQIQTIQALDLEIPLGGS